MIASHLFRRSAVPPSSTMSVRQIASVVIFLFFGVCADHANHDHHRVNVAVYYESLCPDSIKFFTQQLYPSLQGNLSQFVNLTLLPYGKSKTNVDIAGQHEFTCHHGPAECRGNRIQVCAIRNIDRGQPTPGLGYNKVTAAFINCLMDKVKRNGNDTQFPTKECAEINQVTNLHEIDNCANDVDGSRFLNDVGLLTSALSPPLTSVPTIVFNKQFKEDDNQLAQTNFVKALCQYIEKDEKPAECWKNSGFSLKTSVAFVSVVAAMLFYF